MASREKFSGKYGYILAVAGSAVGLGNVWRFPYLAAKYGGGAFLLVYILLVATLGFALMIAESSLGRNSGLSAGMAYGGLVKKYSWLGFFAVIVPIIVVPYYSVITGWIVKYFFIYLVGDGAATTASDFFSNYIGSSIEPMVWVVFVIVLTGLILFKGIKGGIERVNKICMPALLVMSVLLVIYTLTLDGAMAGVKYYLIPDFSKFSLEGLLAALGQMFFSLSLAMGISITYGSYLDKKDSIDASVKRVQIFDTGIAMLSGLMIIPAVFVFSGGDQAALSAGPGLMFVTLPKVFASMGLPRLIGILFFLMTFFAAITSLIALVEAIVASLCDCFKMKRNTAIISVILGTIVLAIPNSLGNGIWSSLTIFGMDCLTFMDFLSNSVLMPIGALLTCLFVGYVIKPQTLIDEVKLSSDFNGAGRFKIIIKYIAPIAIIAILVSSILSSMGYLNL